MHLNDAQLLASSPYELKPDELLHLEHCDLCQSRLAQLNKVREKLSSTPLLTMPKEDFSQIEKIFVEERDSKKIAKIMRQAHAWKKVSIATAASFLIFIVWSVSDRPLYNQNTNDKQRITELMAENEMLQKKYEEFVTLSNQSRDTIIQWQLALADIDSHLQKSYLDRNATEEKIALWQKRQQLIQQILAENKSSFLINT